MGLADNGVGFAGSGSQAGPFSYKDAMFEADPYINVIFDNTLRPVDCNPTAVSYFGFSSKEELLEKLLPLINDSIPAFQPDASPSIPLSTRFEYAIQNGSIEFEIEMVFGEKRVPMRFTLKKIDFGGSFVIAGYMIDMEQLKEARNELIRQDFLMRQVNQAATRLMTAAPDSFDSVAVRCLKLLARSVNADQMSIWKNTGENASGARRLYCWDAFSADGDLPVSVHPELNFERVAGWQALLIKKKSVNQPLAGADIENADGLIAKSSKSILLIPIFLQGEFWGFICLARGSSSQLFSPLEEKALQSGGIMVVQAILRNQVNQSLILAREEAMASDKAKSDFLSRMSHEIRTPMNAITGMTAIAKKTNDLSQIHQSLEKINTASQQLLGIINDILDMAKIESGKFEIERAPFDFTRMLGNVLEMFQGRLEEKKLKLELKVESEFCRTVVCDELRLSQVVINLMSNAIKFTPQNGAITVLARHLPAKCDEAEEEERKEGAARKLHVEKLHVEVRDTGIGIPEEHQHKLFRTFEQADGSITRRFGGTGLGLSICKSITRMLGGDIWVTSQAKQGANFIFEVEFTWGEPVEPQNSAAPFEVGKSYHWAGRRILIAEDMEINREILISLLGDTGLEMDTAENGAQAVEKFRQNCDGYDLILMDLQMPEMDGLSATRHIRASGCPNAATVPIVAMTANAFDEDVRECLAAGMNDHIAKPIDLEITMAKLAQYL